MEKRLRFFFAMFSTSDCGHAFCTTTHLNTLCTGSLRSNHYGMALLQQHHRAAQPVQPQPQNPPSSVSLLHVQLFQGSGKDGWISLGGVLLRITGRQHDFLADFFLSFLFSFFFANSCYHDFTLTPEATNIRGGVDNV